MVFNCESCFSGSNDKNKQHLLSAYYLPTTVKEAPFYMHYPIYFKNNVVKYVVLIVSIERLNIKA